MCTQTEPAVPSGTAQALAMLHASLGYLAGCDAASLSTSAQAEALIGLERAEAQHTAARARMLAAFSAQQGHQADGQFGPKPWLRASTRITNGAAAGAVGWVKRLAAHPLVAEALAAGDLSASWARVICEWADQLPEDRRGDADAILLAAAAGGAVLADLAALAAEMIERSRTTPDQDKDTFTDRAVWLETTIGGAGRLSGDLTGPAAAAVAAVLGALAGKAGPEDTRTLVQRQHDALEEACLRLVAAGMLPGRDGQPLQVNVHVDLAELRGLPGGSALEAGWGSARAAAAGMPGAVYLTGPEAQAAACDAALVPVVTGHIDWAVLDHLTNLYLHITSHSDSPDTGHGAGQDGSQDAGHGHGDSHDAAQDAGSDIGQDPDRDPCQGAGSAAGQGAGWGGGPGPGVLDPGTRERLQHTLLRWSIDLLSGPGGLASYLRTQLLDAPFTTFSQPLDLGRSTRAVPPHLRKAVILRDKHCSFPGCTQPPQACEVHHIIHWTQGGPTDLANLTLLCRFHHNTVIHRWNWALTRHPDGTTTATSPHGRTVHSHGPPTTVA